MALFKEINYATDMDNLKAFTIFNHPLNTSENSLEIKDTGIVVEDGFVINVVVDMQSEAGHPFKLIPHFPMHVLTYTLAGGDIGSIDVNVNGLDAYKFKGISADVLTVMSDIKNHPHHLSTLLNDLLGTGDVKIISVGGWGPQNILDGQHAHATFVFKSDPFGYEHVKFRAGDKIEFAKSLFSSFGDVMSHASLYQGDVVIAGPTYGESITLDTVHHLSHLTASDFLFV
jgi:hypothetical protein